MHHIGHFLNEVLVQEPAVAVNKQHARTPEQPFGRYNYQNHTLSVCGMQVKDREAYYIDLQLLRVTKKLQAVLKGDRGEKDKELVQKTEARVEMMERSHESKARTPASHRQTRINALWAEKQACSLVHCNYIVFV